MCIEPKELIKILQDNNIQVKSDIIEVVKANSRATRAIVEKEATLTNIKIDQLIDHNSRQNSTIEKHQEQINKSGQAIRLTNFVFKRWYILVLGIIGLFFIAQYFYQDNRLFDIVMQFLRLR